MADTFTPVSESSQWIAAAQLAAGTRTPGRNKVQRINGVYNHFNTPGSPSSAHLSGYVRGVAGAGAMTPRRLMLEESVPGVDDRFVSGDKRCNTFFVAALGPLPIVKVAPNAGETREQYNQRLRAESKLFVQHFSLPKSFNSANVLLEDPPDEWCPRLMAVCVCIWDYHVRHGLPSDLLDHARFCEKRTYMSTQQKDLDHFVLVTLASVVAHGKFNIRAMDYPMRDMEHTNPQLYRRFNAAKEVLLHHNSCHSEARNPDGMNASKILDLIPSKSIAKEKFKLVNSIYSQSALLDNVEFQEGTLESDRPEKNDNMPIDWGKRAYFENYKVLMLLWPSTYPAGRVVGGAHCPPEYVYLQTAERNYMQHPHVFYNNPIKHFFHPIQL